MDRVPTAWAPNKSSITAMQRQERQASRTRHHQLQMLLHDLTFMDAMQVEEF